MPPDVSRRPPDAPPDASRRLQPSTRPLKWCLRHPNRLENEVPSRPRGPQNTKLVKNCNFKKTSVFIRFSSHLTLIFRQYIHPRSLKKHPAASGRRFSPQNHEQIPKYLKKKVPGGRQNRPKSIKNRDLDPKVFSVEPPGLPRSSK